MTMIQLFTDGSQRGKQAGWAFIIAEDDVVLYADSGLCNGDSNDGEHLAIIHGLLTLPTSTHIHLVTDRNDVGAALDRSKNGLTVDRSHNNKHRQNL